MNKDKNQLMSCVQELCFLTSSFGVGVGVMPGPDTGTITGSMTAVPNGLAHVTDVSHMHLNGEGVVLHITDDVSHMHLNGEGVVLHIVVGDMQWDILGVTHCEVDGDVYVLVLHTTDDVLQITGDEVHTTDDVLQITGDEVHDTLHATIDELAGVELGTDCEYTLNPDMSVSVKV